MNAVWDKNDIFVVAFTAAPGVSQIIGLSAIEASQAGPKSAAVDHNAIKVVVGHIGKAFLHQSKARAGRRRKRAFAAGCGAHQHIDGRNFIFCLYEGDVALCTTPG
ncbi:hypothetical protein SDC9_137901 [bioreactor metagenome]|uniref:Uncharacterized protein n=1 Tax=bioreactor metagenome TaxID=1076179 RepID=A0A645DNC5_9ZZZZ